MRTRWLAQNRFQAQCFGDAPRLRATPTWRVRRLSVEDLADAADTRAREVLTQTDGDWPQLFDPIGVDAAPRIDKWPYQPRPDSSLMIGKISRAQVATILWLIVRVTRCERPQPIRSEQLLADQGKGVS